MEEFRKYRISDKEIADGVRLGLKNDVKARISHMAEFFGNLTYPDANRRFRNYALNIQDGTVVAVLLFNKEANEKALAEERLRKRARRDAASNNGEGS